MIALFVVALTAGGLCLVPAVAAGGPRAQPAQHHHHHKDKPVHHHGKGVGSRSALTLEEGDLPLKWLFVSLGISAAIGAVAGEVIVNLTGSRP